MEKSDIVGKAAVRKVGTAGVKMANKVGFMKDQRIYIFIVTIAWIIGYLPGMPWTYTHKEKYFQIIEEFHHLPGSNFSRKHPKKKVKHFAETNDDRAG